MMSEPFLDEDYRVLTSEAFDFVLNNELKRAVRSQNFLTLVHVEPTVRGQDSGQAREPGVLLREVARLISRDVRETDLLALTGTGRLSLVLLDADLERSMGVIDRVRSRLDHYEFQRPLDIEVGAACCPTHGADADSLRRAAQTQPVPPRHADFPNASNAQ